MIAEAIARVRSLWSNLVRRRSVDDALDEELAAYVDLAAAEYERAGMSPAEARRQALVDTGGVEQVKEAARDAWLGNALASGGRELRYALRALRRSPSFLVVAIMTLALGIGGATAVFTVTNASLFRPLPATSNPDQLVTVERVQPSGVIAELSYPDYRDLRQRSTALTGLAGYNGTSMKLEDAAGTDRAWVSHVTDNFFTVLGVRPAVGRVFEARDTTVVGAERSVVIGYDLWQQRYGGTRDVVGKTLKLGHEPFTVIGVAPPGFIGGMRQYEMDLWIPITMGSQQSPVMSIDLSSRRGGLLRLVGRLAPGKTVEIARSELAGIAASLAATYPTNRGRSVHVWAGAGMTAEERDEAIRLPKLLAIAVALLLLIACANVATLLLVRSAARRRELATRLALGASRASLVRQLMVEGALLAAGAGLVGVILGRALVRSAVLVQTVVPLEYSQLDLRLDPRVLALAVAASALTALLVSVMPAFQISRLSPAAVLKDGSGGAVRRRSLGQRSLVATQVAASLVLLAGAAITFSAFQRVLDSHSAVDPRALADVGIEAREVFRDRAPQLAFYGSVLEHAAASPAIADAALTTTIPPFQWASRASLFRRGEEPSPGALVGRESELGVRAQVVHVSPGFFGVMRMPILRGRAFAVADDDGAPPVAVVSRRVADALWPGRNPIGQEIAWPAVEGARRPPVRVVGVVSDTPDLAPGAEAPLVMYVPYRQQLDPQRNYILVARASGRSPLTSAELRQIVTAADSRVSAVGGTTLFDRLRGATRPQRTASVWIGVFGAIALLLASIGLYGIVAQGVLQRTRELAVRAALGATPRGILAMILGEGARLAAFGVAIGILGAVAAFRVLRTLFTGVDTVDPASALVGLAALTLAVLAATLIPARRASRLNPADALRSD